MKSDPDKVDSFLERLKMKPVAAAPAPAQPKAHAAQRAKRAPGLVMRMDGWNISGNVVIVPDAGTSVLSQLLSAPAPQSTDGGVK